MNADKSRLTFRWRRDRSWLSERLRVAESAKRSPKTGEKEDAGFEQKGAKIAKEDDAW
jgi:hypothetical protein